MRPQPFPMNKFLSFWTAFTSVCATVFMLCLTSGCGSTGDSSQIRIEDAGYTVDMLAEETINRLKISAATGEVSKVRESSEDKVRGADPSKAAGRKDPNAVSTIVEDTVTKLNSLRKGQPPLPEAAVALDEKIQAASVVDDKIKNKFLTELRTTVSQTKPK